MAKEYQFLPDKWKCVNSFNTNYAYPKNNSGVYLLVKPEPDYENRKFNYEILYVGSSTKLKQRYENHEVIKKLTDIYGYVQFFFRECDNFLIEEYKLIKKIQPKYNKIGK